MSSANAFKLDWSQILSFGKALSSIRERTFIGIISIILWVVPAFHLKISLTASSPCRRLMRL